MILHKYFAPDRIDVLRDGVIRFTQFAALNDPFDCRPRLFEPEQLASVPTSSDGADCPCCTRSYVIGVQEALVRSQLFRQGVLCLTEKHNNLLMWSHYAQNHEGFVLGFETGHEFFERSDNSTGLHKVAYQEERPTLPAGLFNTFLQQQPRMNPYGLINAHFGSDTFDISSDEPDYRFVKSPEWEYEQEWRLVRRIRPPYRHIKLPSGHPVYLFPFPHRMLHSVIIGCRAFAKLFPEIREILNQNIAYEHVQVFEASPDNDKFSVHVEKFVVAMNTAQISESADVQLIALLRANGVLIPSAEAEFRNLTNDWGVASVQPRDVDGIRPMPPTDDDRQRAAFTEDVLRGFIGTVREARKANDPLFSLKSRVDLPANVVSADSAEYTFNRCLTVLLDMRSEETPNNEKLALAMKLLDHAIDLSQTRADGLFDAGLLFKSLGIGKVAMLYLEAAIREDSGHIQSNYVLGNTLLDEMHIWEAEAAYRVVLLCAPQHAQARTNLGALYRSAGRIKEAKACFLRAIEDDAKCWQAQLNLAGLNLNEDQVDDALDRISKVFNNDVAVETCVTVIDLIHQRIE